MSASIFFLYLHNVRGYRHAREQWLGELFSGSANVLLLLRLGNSILSVVPHTVGRAVEVVTA